MYGFGFNCQHLSSASSAVLVMMWLGSVWEVLVVDCISENTTQRTLNECVCVECMCEQSVSKRSKVGRSGNLKNTTAVVFSLLRWMIFPSQNKLNLLMYLFLSKTVDFYMLTAEADMFCVLSYGWVAKHDCCLSCSVLYLFFFFWMSNTLFPITIEWPSLFLKVHFNRYKKKNGLNILICGWST